MAKKKIKVLFFIAGMKATDAEDAAMNKFTNRHVVCVRNASMIGDNDGIEDFDEVAGEVPAVYAEAAALKPKPSKEPKPPKADPKTVDPQSPAAPKTPPAGQEGNQGDNGDQTPPAGAEDGNTGDQTPPVVDGNVKPKAPEPKPGAGKGWKPNS